MKESQTDIAFLRFDDADAILFITVKEGAVMTVDNISEHYQEIKRLTSGKPYAAFVDTTHYYSVDNETLKFTAQHEVIDQRVATVHFNPGLANRMTANFFRNFHKPPIPFTISNNREEAIAWLKDWLRAKKPD